MNSLVSLLDLAGDIVLYAILGPILLITGLHIIYNALTDTEGYFDGYTTPGSIVQRYDLQDSPRKLQGYLLVRGATFTALGIIFLSIGALIAYGHLT